MSQEACYGVSLLLNHTSKIDRTREPNSSSKMLKFCDHESVFKGVLFVMIS